MQLLFFVFVVTVVIVTVVATNNNSVVATDDNDNNNDFDDSRCYRCNGDDGICSNLIARVTFNVPRKMHIAAPIQAFSSFSLLLLLLSLSPLLLSIVATAAVAAATIKHFSAAFEYRSNCCRHRALLDFYRIVCDRDCDASVVSFMIIVAVAVVVIAL